jgi:drug/metabolite transporter (DMT)-like permease
LCFLGAVLVTWHDEEEIKDIDTNTDSGDGGNGSVGVGRSLVGDGAALISAMLYGMYTVILRLWIRESEEEDEEDEEQEQEEEEEEEEEVRALELELGYDEDDDERHYIRSRSSPAPVPVPVPVSIPSHYPPTHNPHTTTHVSTPTFTPVPIPLRLILGYIGLIITLLGLPILICSIIYCWEGSICFFTWKLFAYIMLLAIANNFCSEYLWAKCILLTSPTVATVGLSLTIPIAYCIDYFIMNVSGSGEFLSGIGAMLTILGFLFVNLTDKVLFACWEWCTGSSHGIGS